MFKVEVICHDNRLPKLMWAMVGLVVGEPKVVPLKLEGEEPAENGDGAQAEGAQPSKPSRGSGKNVLPLKAAGWLVEHPPERIARRHLVEAMVAVGGGASADYMIKWLREHSLMTGPVDGEFKLNAAKLSRLLAHQETQTDRGIPPQPLPQQRPPLKQRIEKRGKPKGPFGETLPGRVIKWLADEGFDAVDASALRAAITAVGGHIGSIYYVALTLQNLNLLGEKRPNQTYAVNTETYHQMMTPQSSPE